MAATPDCQRSFTVFFRARPNPKSSFFSLDHPEGINLRGSGRGKREGAAYVWSACLHVVRFAIY